MWYGKNITSLTRIFADDDAQFICGIDYNRQLPRCQQVRGEAYSLPGKRFAPIAPARLVYLPGVGLAAFKKMIVIRT